MAPGKKEKKKKDLGHRKNLLESGRGIGAEVRREPGNDVAPGDARTRFQVALRPSVLLGLPAYHSVI